MVSDEEKSRRPFENISTEEELEENRILKVRPFEDEVEHQLIHIRVPDEIPTGNVFDTSLFEPEPAKMILKKLKDEGYDV